LPRLSEVPSSGFGYPLDGVSPVHPRKPLSAPNAPGLHPSELCSFPGIESRSPEILSALALPFQPCRLKSGASAACSPRKSRIPLAPNGLGRVGTLALLGLLTSQALSTTLPEKKSLSSLPTLASFLPVRSHDRQFLGTSGPWEGPRRRFPLQGAGLSGLSSACRLPSL